MGVRVLRLSLGLGVGARSVAGWLAWLAWLAGWPGWLGLVGLAGLAGPVRSIGVLICS